MKILLFNKRIDFNKAYRGGKLVKKTKSYIYYNSVVYSTLPHFDIKSVTYACIFFFISSPFVFWLQNLIHLWANHSFTDQIYGSVLMVFFFDLSRSIFVSAWGFQFRSLVSLIFGAGAKRPWNYGVVSTIQQPGNSHCHKTTVINKNHRK